MGAIRVLGLAFGFLFLAPCGAALAQFTMIATTGTSIPGGSGTFSSLTVGAISSSGTVAFSGTGSSGQQGIYIASGGALSVSASK